MRMLLIAVSAAFSCGLAADAQAAPRLTYNQLTGNITVYNDVPNSIINIKSPQGVLHAPPLPDGPIGGAGVLDLGDLPNFIAIIYAPVGSFKLGNGTVDTFIPGTYMNFEAYVPDPQYLAFDWYADFGKPANRGYWVPEPTSAVIGSLGLFGMLAARRRCARW